VKEKQLRYENFPESELMCALCGDWTATLLIMRDELPPEDNTSKAVCCECVSCLVTARSPGRSVSHGRRRPERVGEQTVRGGCRHTALVMEWPIKTEGGATQLQWCESCGASRIFRPIPLRRVGWSRWRLLPIGARPSGPGVVVRGVFRGLVK
jgi:hypothetical protein